MIAQRGRRLTTLSKTCQSTRGFTHKFNITAHKNTNDHSTYVKVAVTVSPEQWGDLEKVYANLCTFVVVLVMALLLLCLLYLLTWVGTCFVDLFKPEMRFIG